MGTIHPVPQEAVTGAVGAVTSCWAPIFLKTDCEHQYNDREAWLLPCRNVEEQRLNSAGVGADSSVYLTMQVVHHVFFSCHINFLLVASLKLSSPLKSAGETHRRRQPTKKATRKISKRHLQHVSFSSNSVRISRGFASHLTTSQPFWRLPPQIRITGEMQNVRDQLGN